MNELPVVDELPEAELPAAEPGQQWDADGLIRPLNHEDLVMEISELVHRQLVSSTLSGSGGFRNRLERLVMVSLACIHKLSERFWVRVGASCCEMGVLLAGGTPPS